jgi:hypothetical protein
VLDLKLEGKGRGRGATRKETGQGSENGDKGVSCSRTDASARAKREEIGIGGGCVYIEFLENEGRHIENESLLETTFLWF